MQKAFESLDSRAPWLDRTDAVSANRLQILTGMNRNQWNDWLANPIPIKPSGRIGNIVEAEFSIEDSMPISIEWNIKNFNSKGIPLANIQSKNVNQTPSNL